MAGAESAEAGPPLDPGHGNTAMGIVAALNADVSCAAADADYALARRSAASQNWLTADGRFPGGGDRSQTAESHLRRPTERWPQ